MKTWNVAPKYYNSLKILNKDIDFIMLKQYSANGLLLFLILDEISSRFDVFAAQTFFLNSNLVFAVHIPLVHPITEP